MDEHGPTKVNLNVISSTCDVCRKKIKYKSSLIRHKRVHTGEKPS